MWFSLVRNIGFCNYDFGNRKSWLSKGDDGHIFSNDSIGKSHLLLAVFVLISKVRYFIQGLSISAVIFSLYIYIYIYIYIDYCFWFSLNF